MKRGLCCRGDGGDGPWWHPRDTTEIAAPIWRFSCSQRRFMGGLGGRPTRSTGVALGVYRCCRFIWVNCHGFVSVGTSSRWRHTLVGDSVGRATSRGGEDRPLRAAGLQLIILLFVCAALPFESLRDFVDPSTRCLRQERQARPARSGEWLPHP